jgi:hypothetical protein
VAALVPSHVNGTNKKLYVEPPVRPESTYDVDGAVGKFVGVMVINVPTPAVGALPLADDKVGVPVE